MPLRVSNSSLNALRSFTTPPLYNRAPSCIQPRFFSASAIDMGRAWFDVEYTDAALDQARRKAQQSGGDVPARKSSLVGKLWKTLLNFSSKARTNQLHTLRRCSPEDSRELSSSMHWREGIWIQRQQISQNHSSIHASGW